MFKSQYKTRSVRKVKNVVDPVCHGTLLGNASLPLWSSGKMIVPIVMILSHYSGYHLLYLQYPVLDKET